MKQILELPQLTDKCHHWDEVSEVPWDLQKYWQQRYSYWENYDDGIVMTDDAWFGVTPEPVAYQISNDASKLASSGKTVLIDLFCGVGGNTIAFAASGRWEKIIAIEKDYSTLVCAMHNARIFGLEQGIVWLHGDCFEYLKKLREGAVEGDLVVDRSSAVVFGSPPWGGPGYRSEKIFDLSKMEPYNLEALHKACVGMDHALYLPRTSDLRQIARLAPEGTKIEAVQYCMLGASKALVAYIPAQGTEQQQGV